MEKILVVVDMQNDFIDGSLGTPEAQAIVSKVAEKILWHEGRVVCTQDTHNNNYLNTEEGKRLPIPHCIKKTLGWFFNNKIIDALETQLEVVNVRKPTFGSAALPEIIREILDVEDYKNPSIELVGLCTDICVISNALLLKAHFPNIPISVDSTCCAGTTPEKHAAALEVMRSCQIDVL